jgi:hypothetical protein
MFAVKSLSDLSKNHWTWTIQSDGNGSQGHDGQEKQNHEWSNYDVHDALYKALRLTKRRPLELDGRSRFARRPGKIRQRANALVRHQSNSDGKGLDFISDELDPTGIAPGQRNQYLSAIVVPHKIGCSVDDPNVFR